MSSSYTVNSTNTLDNLTANATLLAEQLQQWESTRTGELVIGPSNQVGWLRLPDNSSIFESAADPSAGPTSAHYQLFFSVRSDTVFSMPVSCNRAASRIVSYLFQNLRRLAAISLPYSLISFLPRHVRHACSLGPFPALTSGIQGGNVTLASKDPFEYPVIQPNFFSTDFDIFTIRESIKAARRYLSAPAWNDWILEEFGSFAQAQTDAEIEQYARNSAFTVFHMCGTSAMGRTGSVGRGSGALNADLTVKGTVGLRVVDASAFVSSRRSRSDHSWR